MPFRLGWNSTKMHLFTHFKFTHFQEGVAGKTGLGIDNEGMVEHDRLIGELRAQFKELGIEDNTIVMGATEKGSEAFTWPAGGTTMFRVEQNTLWEGGLWRARRGLPSGTRHVVTRAGKAVETPGGFRRVWSDWEGSSGGSAIGRELRPRTMLVRDGERGLKSVVMVPRFGVRLRRVASGAVHGAVGALVCQSRSLVSGFRMRCTTICGW